MRTLIEYQNELNKCVTLIRDIQYQQNANYTAVCKCEREYERNKTIENGERLDTLYYTNDLLSKRYRELQEKYDTLKDIIHTIQEIECLKEQLVIMTTMFN